MCWRRNLLLYFAGSLYRSRHEGDSSWLQSRELQCRQFRQGCIMYLIWFPLFLKQTGRIAALRIFQDGSGLAYTATKTANAGTFVSSAGYPTAVTGFLMLLFRRTTLGPTIGLIVLGSAMILSVILFVKNDFGRWFLSAEAAVLLFFSWKMPAHYTDNLYNFLAATCCLNAVENVRDLFGSSYIVNGKEISGTDAHSTADGWGGDYRMWAMIWLWFSLGMTVLGILCGFDARRLPSCVRPSQSDATAIPYGAPTTGYTNMGTPAVAYPVQANTAPTYAVPQKKLHAAQVM